MSPGGSLAERVARLRRQQALRAGGSPAAIPAAEPLSGEWGEGCVGYEASFAQARLWFLHELEPGLSAY
ncbi:MAG: hypothetical protein VKK62_11460, partial [Synechococcaceae cyanobacterium]|nr:hypothetical protein [Synechococcaceae cyanobacterium]